MILNILCLVPSKQTTQKTSILTIFSMQFMTLQQAQITVLTETMCNVSTMWMNEQKQSFRPLANSIFD